MTDVTSQGGTASREIDAIIRSIGGWRGETLSRLRSLITQAEPSIVEERKWRKPSRPQGVPVWTHGGNICIGEALKNAVRLTFPNGALIKDPKKVFNTRLDSKTVRAVDVREDDAIDGAALRALIRHAVELNRAKRV